MLIVVVELLLLLLLQLLLLRGLVLSIHYCYLLLLLNLLPVFGSMPVLWFFVS